jgi:paraquat-inducible protein A
MAINQPLARYPEGSAARHALASCTLCHQLVPVQDQTCSRCGSRLHLRTPNSVQTTLSFVITAILLYIPANIFPIMTTELLGRNSPSTIIGGVLLFLDHGSYFIAFVIFTASVIVPIAKILSLCWLCYAAKKPVKLNQYELTRLYRLTEFVGKWSMIDIFVVAILVALVQVGEFMSIQPGIAASAFTSVVILTMIAAQQFDIRLIWDRLQNE